MNIAPAEKIANAILYEGYLLYPYRPDSTKNRQRWNFGTLFPPAAATIGLSSFHAEVLVNGNDLASTEDRQIRGTRVNPNAPSRRRAPNF